MQEVQLTKDEIIEMEIFHKKKLPFRLVDWIKLLISIGLCIAAIASIQSEGYISIGSVFILTIILFIYFPWFLRWKNLQPLKYIVTNKRLIIYNSVRKTIKHSFEFSAFPVMTFHENAYNSGYIILGQVQPSITNGNGLDSFSFGINLLDHGIVLENIPSVKKIFHLLTDKVENSHKNL